MGKKYSESGDIQMIDIENNKSFWLTLPVRSVDAEFIFHLAEELNISRAKVLTRLFEYGLSNIDRAALLESPARLFQLNSSSS
jgi:hypothetical protein